MKYDEINKESYDHEENRFDEYQNINNDIYTTKEIDLIDSQLEKFDTLEFTDSAEEVSAKKHRKAVDMQTVEKIKPNVASIASKVATTATVVVGAAVILPVILRSAPKFELVDFNVTSTTVNYSADIGLIDKDDDITNYSFILQYENNTIDFITVESEGLNNYKFNNLTPDTSYTLLLMSKELDEAVYEKEFKTLDSVLDTSYYEDYGRLVVSLKSNINNIKEDGYNYYIKTDDGIDTKIFEYASNGIIDKEIVVNNYNDINITTYKSIDNTIEIVESNVIQFEDSYKISRIYVDSFIMNNTMYSNEIEFTIGSILLDSNESYTILDEDNNELSYEGNNIDDYIYYASLASKSQKDIEFPTLYINHIKDGVSTKSLIDMGVFGDLCEDVKYTIDDAYITYENNKYNMYVCIGDSIDTTYSIDGNELPLVNGKCLYTTTNDSINDYSIIDASEARKYGRALYNVIVNIQDNNKPMVSLTNKTGTITLDYDIDDISIRYNSSGQYKTINSDSMTKANNSYSFVVDEYLEELKATVIVKKTNDLNKKNEFIDYGFEIKGSDTLTINYDVLVTPTIINNISYSYYIDNSSSGSSPKLVLIMDQFIEDDYSYQLAVNNKSTETFDKSDIDMYNKYTYDLMQLSSTLEFKLSIIDNNDEVVLEGDTVSINTDALNLVNNYFLSHANPGDSDVGVTYNNDDTINIYINTQFEVTSTQFDDLYYSVIVGEGEYYSHDKIFEVKNLDANRSYALIYNVYGKKNDVVYLLDTINPSGTVDPNPYISGTNGYDFDTNKLWLDVGANELFSNTSEDIFNKIILTYDDNTTKEYALSYDSAGYKYECTPNIDKKAISGKYKIRIKTMSDDLLALCNDNNISIAGNRYIDVSNDYNISAIDCDIASSTNTITIKYFNIGNDVAKIEIYYDSSSDVSEVMVVDNNYFEKTITYTDSFTYLDLYCKDDKGNTIDDKTVYA